MRRSIVAANWKMNGQRAEIETLLDGLLSVAESSCEVVICPPSIYIEQVRARLVNSPISLGGQNIFTEDSGAYTGEISAPMLTDLNCTYVLVGHSERRELFAESDKLVAEKFSAAQANGLIPILCVGESQAEREANETETVILRQLQAVIEHNGIEAFSRAVIAYEPIWAIGTGLTATPDEAQKVHQVIRQFLSKQHEAVADKISILYGGSVKASNASELFSQTDIDGALVGGASLIAEEFNAIRKAASS